nr:unnamed protein product [Callosobruchus analis]
MPKKQKPEVFTTNCEVIEKKKGEMILVRKPSQRAEAKNYECYGPCPRCLGFFLKELLNSNRSKSAFSESNALMASTVGKSNPEFYENILSGSPMIKFRSCVSKIH